MSRIGKLPITVPKGVDVQIDADNVITVKGPKGTLSQSLHPDLTIEQEDGALQVTRASDDRLPPLAARPDPHACSTTWCRA